MTIRLATAVSSQGGNVLLGRRGVKQLSENLKPSLLVSYVYLSAWLRKQKEYVYRDWALDSGAFSAYNKGTEIDLQDYI